MKEGEGRGGGGSGRVEGVGEGKGRGYEGSEWEYEGNGRGGVSSLTEQHISSSVNISSFLRVLFSSSFSYNFTIYNFTFVV